MALTMFQLDAFSDRPFAGNPAAVVPLESWPADALLQAIALENNLSETAFLVREPAGWRIRWFTPAIEVDLCGHATLAAAWVVLERLEPGAAEVAFASRSGPLVVRRDGARLALDFPSRPGRPVPAPAALIAGLGASPAETLLSRDLMAVFADEDEIRALAPDLPMLARVEALGVIATAPGRDCDFVSRFFAPQAGVGEDPVTGSSHCTLTPYWAARLGKRALHAHQLSARGGELWCEDRGERVIIAGHVTPYLEGTIRV